MGQLKLLIIHCLDTPKGMHVTKDMIDDWHRAPLKNADGTVTYLGKTYKSLDYANVSAKHKGKWGRGWDRLGYSDIIHENGDIENITPYNNDDFVDNSEMTWGATGVNSTGRHIAIEGGKAPYGIDSITDGEFISLERYCRTFVEKHPEDKIGGHNQFSSKPCPNFSTIEFCKMIGIPDINIYGV